MQSQLNKETMNTQCLLAGVVVTLFAFLFYKYFIGIYNYWRDQGIPYVEGALPIVGNSLSVITFRESLSNFCERIYKIHENQSMIGFYQFREPTLLIKDPEIVKTVLISGFSNFHINLVDINQDLDPLLAQNPFFTQGEEWKMQRSRLTNALMSSKKLKLLFIAISNVCLKFDKYLQDNVRKSKGSFETESKEFFSMFTGEVVTSAGFGAEGDFFSNGSGPNSFNEAFSAVFDTSIVGEIRQALLFFLPTLKTLFGSRFIPEHSDRFFRGVIKEIIKMREKDGIARNDFLQIMVDTQKAKGEELDELGITASATSFFLDGYETSAITLSFFAYQVAANQHVQDKLRKEVTTVLEKYNGEMTYDSLSEMTYMDQALNESMRLYPAVFFIMKRCNESCKIFGRDGIECLVEPGTSIIIPIRCLQTDPEYWKNPEIYDPERFSDENKKGRPKTVFLPFGEGPRICVGMRFATLQIKAAMATIMRTYSIEVSLKTQVPLKMKTTAFLTAVEGGLWIKLKPL